MTINVRLCWITSKVEQRSSSRVVVLNALDSLLTDMVEIVAIDTMPKVLIADCIQPIC